MYQIFDIASLFTPAASCETDCSCDSIPKSGINVEPVNHEHPGKAIPSNLAPSKNLFPCAKPWWVLEQTLHLYYSHANNNQMLAGPQQQPFWIYLSIHVYLPRKLIFFNVITATIYDLSSSCFPSSLLSNVSSMSFDSSFWVLLIITLVTFLCKSSK